MCSSNAADRIGIRDVIYRMELLAHDDLPRLSNIFNADSVERTVVVEELISFKRSKPASAFSSQRLFYQLQATVDPLPLDVVERFSLILVRFLDSLDRRGFGGGNLVASVCASRTIAIKNYSIRRDLDRLAQCTPQLHSVSSIHTWVPHFHEMQELQHATLQGYWETPLPTLNELDSEADPTEAAALLEFESHNHGAEFPALGASHLSGSSLSKWFGIHHIADGSFGSVYEAKWLGTDVVVKML